MKLEISEILYEHNKWLVDVEEGKPANLREANLREANYISPRLGLCLK